MLFYRLYRPLGRVGTVIPGGTYSIFLTLFSRKKSTILVRSDFSLSIITWWMGLDREEKKAKISRNESRYAYLVRLFWGVRRIYPR